MSQVSFLPLMKAQSKSLRQPVAVTLSNSDYKARMQRLGMARERKLVRRAEVASLRETLAAEEAYAPVPENIEFKPGQCRLIVMEMCAKHRISWAEFYSKNRKKKFVAARKEAAWKMVVDLKMSYPETARRLGYAEHTAVLNLVRSYARLNGLLVEGRSLTQSQKEKRNKRIVQSLTDGELINDIAKRENLDRKTVRFIARRMGFDLEKGSDARIRAAAEERRLVRKLQQEALGDAMLRSRAALRAINERKAREIEAAMPRLVAVYRTIRAASIASGYTRQTISKYAKRMGLEFKR